MKKLTIILLLFAGTVSAQGTFHRLSVSEIFQSDSTVVLNLSLKVNMIEFLSGSIKNPDNAEEFPTLLKWVAIWRATKPASNTNIITDTIPTVLVAKLYNYAMSAPGPFGVDELMKTAIASKRAGNSYLNALCTQYEAEYTARLKAQKEQGRKLLIGK